MLELRDLGGLLAVPPGDVSRRAAGDKRQQHKGEGRRAGQQRQGHEQHRTHAQCLGITRELRAYGHIHRVFQAALGHHDAGGGGDDEGGDLGDETVTDGQARIGVGGVGEGQVLLRHADDHAADDVDGGDDQAGDGVAAHELRGTVHGTEEVGFFLQFLAARAGFVFVDQAGGQVGVDGHLLAGHGVQGETRRHFGDTRRTFGDDHEVHQGEDREDDDADDEAVAHDETAEGLDDVTGGRRAFVTVGQNQAGRGQVEGEAHQGGDQQHHREGVELHGFANKDHGHENQHGQRDRHGQGDVEQPGRQRHDQHDHDEHEA